MFYINVYDIIKSYLNHLTFPFEVMVQTFLKKSDLKPPLSKYSI